MYGHIHIILKDLVTLNFGASTWLAILKEAGFENEASILDTVQQPDEVSYKLVGATCTVTKLSADDALEAFGHHFVVFALKSGNARFLKAQGATLHAFLENVNNLHNHLERDHPNAKFPFIQSDYDPVKDELDLEYISTRKGLGKVVVGVVKEIGKRIYGLDVTMQEQESKSLCFEDEFEEGHGCAWRVAWKPLKGGPVPLEPSKEEAAAPVPQMSFFALHAAMMDFGKILRNPELWAPCSCSRQAQCKTDLARKLEELENPHVLPEAVLLRCTKARHIAAAWSDPSLGECRDFWKSSDGRPTDYEISQDAEQVDIFVSHCWSPPENWALAMGADVEYAEVKTTTLAVMAKDVAQINGSLEDWGEVTFWVDKACIPQDNAELKSACINLLEKFIHKCDYMCVIFTWTYLDRLWCVYEWACVLVHKEPSKVFMQTELFVKEETMPLYLETVRYFSLARTKCFDEADRAILQAKINAEYVSEEAFEKLVQATAIALMARSMAFRAGRSAELRQRFYTPWVKLAKKLGMHDLAQALSRSRSTEWRVQASRSVVDNSPIVSKTFSLLSEPGSPVVRRLSSSSTPNDKQTPTGFNPTLLGQFSSCIGINAAKYQRSVSEWFDVDVAPILEQIRDATVKKQS
eukprot:gb/GFBE01048358.1/.p1 GENE.gb/GFBE01048358.1/~~gb/GFBE01048358.1/.p1  ORF type:complete len:636 (+),score=142.77 gb/GFBE01048358.1/:1-1908(+)